MGLFCMVVTQCTYRDWLRVVAKTVEKHASSKYRDCLVHVPTQSPKNKKNSTLHKVYRIFFQKFFLIFQDDCCPSRKIKKFS